MKLIMVPLPEYTVVSEPDHHTIGRSVDATIRANFPMAKIIARGVSADDHPGLDVDGLIKIIEVLGTDRYDPDRTGDRYDNVEESPSICSGSAARSRRGCGCSINSVGASITAPSKPTGTRPGSTS
ncbi:hypothetical protein GCM10027613_48790 [Microlunatus endophyticus]